MSYVCSSCGKAHTGRNYPNNLCQNCYHYFLKGGRVYELPEYGRIIHNEDGLVICHICGRAYARLGSHVRETHHMTIAEYKEKFGLCSNSRTTEPTYSRKMSEYAYANGMPEQLMKFGFDTRIKTGEKDKRFGKKARLQESLDKKDRYS